MASIETQNFSDHMKDHVKIPRNQPTNGNFVYKTHTF